MPCRLITTFLYIAAVLLSTAAASAQQCWATAPAHGQVGVDFQPVSSTVWDPGSGPRLVVGPTVGIALLGQVRYWENGKWTMMDGLFNGSVLDLTVYNGSLYACGEFTQVGPYTVHGIARWDGISWVPVNIFSPIVLQSGQRFSTMKEFNGDLWVGGSFTRQGVSGVQHYAVFSGSVLTNSGNQTGGHINTFCVHNGALYAGAARRSYVLQAGVSRWTGSTWQLVGELNTNDTVYALESFNNQLVAAGSFLQIAAPGGAPVQANHIARLAGTTWQPLAGGMSPSTSYDYIIALKPFGNRLVAAGRFGFMNGLPRKKIAAWNGVNWDDMGGGIDWVYNPPTSNDAVWALDIYNNELVAMGLFYQAGGLEAPRIARYNGVGWLPFIEGINGPINAMIASGSSIFVGGAFSFNWLNQGVMHHVMRVDGTALDPLVMVQTGGRGTGGNVHALGFHMFSALQGPRLIIGGAFASAGGINASNIVSYSLTTTQGYSALGAGLNGPVTAVASYGGAVWAAGAFSGSGASGEPLYNIARYVGGNWVRPGPWVFPAMQTMMVHDGMLIIGGAPNQTGGVSAFDGITLHHYGAANGVVRAMVAYEGDLVVAGDFTTIGGVNAMRIARRSRTTGQWSAMGGGLGEASVGQVMALAVHKGELYAGGAFTQSGGVQVNRLARWTGSSWQPLPRYSQPGGVDAYVSALASIGGSLHIGGAFQRTTDGHVSPFWIQYECTPCYANCDNSHFLPVLNVDDFTCFINRFALAATLPHHHQVTHWANCDGSTTVPALNVDDFTCFINRYALGCF
jgi:trimeric autotransporter adhesin